MENELEQSMADIVYSQLQDQLPELRDKLVGYHMITAEEDNRKVLGVLIFKIHDKHFLLPTIFVNGFLKPLIILLDYKEKTLRPATKKIVSMLIKPRPMMSDVKYRDIGESTELLSNPNLKEFLYPSSFRKYGSDKGNIAKMIKNGSLCAKKRLALILVKSSEFLSSVVKRYPDIVNLLNYEKLEPFHKKAESLEVFVSPSPTLSDPENEKILNDSIFVKDKRLSVADVLPIETYTTFGTPVENGMYEVINYGGQLKKYLCLIKSNYNKIFLIDLSDGTCNYTDYDRVCARRCKRSETEKAWEKIFEDSIPIVEAEHKKEYMLFCPSSGYTTTSEIICPFKVDKIYRTPEGIFTIKTNFGKITMNPNMKNRIDVIKGKTDEEWIVGQDSLLYPVSSSEYINDLGDLQNLLRYIYQSGIQKISIDKMDSHRYSISNQDGMVEKRGSERDVLVYLIKEKNMSEKSARSVVGSGGEFFLLDKKAFSVPTYDTPYIEVKPANVGGRYSVPTYDKYISEHRTRQTPFNPIYPPQEGSIEDDIKFALGASMVGQDNAIDSAILEIMAKGENNIERIRESIPVLNQTTHDLGSILYSLWWKPKDFMDYFTIDNLYNFEQSLLSTFKNLGDISHDLSMMMRIQE